MISNPCHLVDDLCLLPVNLSVHVSVVPPAHHVLEEVAEEGQGRRSIDATLQPVAIVTFVGQKCQKEHEKDQY